jgi:hypothetical protein
MALPAFRSKGAYGSGTTSCVAAVPTGGSAPQTNDILLIVVESSDSTTVAGTPNTPGGWTKIFEETQGAGATGVTTLTVFGKRAGASESDVTVDGVGNHCSASMFVFSGCITTGDAWVVGTGNGGNAGGVTITGLSTPVADCLVLMICATSRDANFTTQFSSWTNVNLTGITEREDNGVATGAGGGIGLAEGGKSSAGATGDSTVTQGTSAIYRSVHVALKPVPAGTQFNQSVSGGITPSGSTLKDDRKILSGGNTPSGTILKLPSKSFSGTTTPAGVVSKFTSKIIQGAISVITGALIAARLFFTSLSGTITPSGNIGKDSQKSFSGSLTSSGSTDKLSNKSFDGSVASSGISTRQINKTTGGELSFISGILNTAKTAVISLGGSLGLSGLVLKFTNKSTDGLLNSNGSLNNQTSKPLGGNISGGGSLDKLSERSLSGIITPTGDNLRQTNKIFSGDIVPSGGLFKDVIKSLSGVLSTVGSLVADFVPGGGNQFFQSVSGTLSSSGEIIKQASKALSGDLIPFGSTLKDSFKSFIGTLISFGEVSKNTSKTYEGNISPTGDISLTRLLIKVLSGELSFSGLLSKLPNKQLSGNLQPSGTINKLVTKFISGVLNFIGNLLGIPSGLQEEINQIYLSGSIELIINLEGSSISEVRLLGNKETSIYLKGEK